MSDRVCVTAFTAVSPSYPAYLSVNRESDGRYVVSARGPDGQSQHTSQVTMHKEELRAFFVAGLAKLDELVD